MSKKGFLTSIFVVVCLTLYLVGCGGQKSDVQRNALATPKEVSVADQPVEWKADGIISDNEYTRHQKIGQIDVFTRVNGDTVMMALRAETKGYIALGIDPEDKMKGADILMCSVKEDKVSLVEMYSTGVFGPHPPKQDSAAIVGTVNGSYQDGVLVIEFARKMNPGGPQDKALRIGENKVIWAVGDNNDVIQKHSQRGYGTLVL